MRSVGWLLGTLIWMGCSADFTRHAPDDAGSGEDAEQTDPEVDAGEEPGPAEDAGAGEDARATSAPDAAVTPNADAGICTSCGACAMNIRVSSAAHRSDPINYPDVPPVGGDHNPCWTTFGVHAKEVPDENWVHNLEHGAVVFLYNCPDGCAADQAKLEALAKGRPFALVMPYAALPTRFGAVAWENRLLSDCYDDAALRAFYTAHVDNALESSTSGPPSGCP